MGGQAFSNTGHDSPVSVPRMSPEVYKKVASEVQAQLETLFSRVTIPREAPAKRDYGDIDFLVEGIIPSSTPEISSIWPRVKEVIHAVHQVTRGSSHSFAIEHPDIRNAYVQIDVEISPGNDTPDAPELFEWTKFMKSDADLMQIIGVCHRSLGISCNDRGLHLRVEEIEPYNKKKSLLFLTRIPSQAMDFYGFDVSKYWAGFGSEEDLFDWVSRGRFFSRDVFDDRVEKANDRSRQKKRPMYRRFIEEYMPGHPEVGASNIWTRAEVLESALETFNKREEYESMMKEHETQEADSQLWKEIKESLPLEGNALGLAVKSLKRWVNFKEGQPYVTTEALIEKGEQPVWVEAISNDRKDELLDWVSNRWAEVKALEKARSAAAKEAGKDRVDNH